MIRIILIIVIANLFLLSCGVKDKPKHKSQNHYNNIIYKV